VGRFDREIWPKRRPSLLANFVFVTCSNRIGAIVESRMTIRIDRTPSLCRRSARFRLCPARPPVHWPDRRI